MLSSAERVIGRVAAALAIAAGLQMVAAAVPPQPRRDRPTLPPPQVDADIPPPGTPPGVVDDGSGLKATSQDSDDPGAQRYDVVGYASWYGDEMGGGRTASGQKFDARAISAAHPTLPMGSYAEVTALDTGRTILVVVTDRGPNGPSRIIDLSRGAAEQLGIDRAGIAAVRVRRVDASLVDQAALRDGRMASPRIDAPPLLLTALRKRLPVRGRSVPPVRQAARADRPSQAALPANPEELANGWFVQVVATSSRTKADDLAESIGGSVTPAGSIFRVRMGPFGDAASAERARDEVARRGYGDARMLRQ